jgi:hypothetical protein
MSDFRRSSPGISAAFVSVSLYPPLLLRLAGGTGGKWLDIFEILSFRET